MSILHDFHMHSSFSSDSTASMESMIQSAISKNLKGICMTEHYDIDYPNYFGDPTPPFLVDFEAYRARYLELEAKYQNKLEFLFGLL